MASSDNSSGASLIARIFTGGLFLVLAVVVVMALSNFRETPKVEKPKVLAPTAAVEKLNKLDKRLLIDLNGTVEAIKESQIVAQVSGRIATVDESSFVAGGIVHDANQVLVTIDDADYQSAKAMAAAEITRVNAQVAQLGALKAQAEVGVLSAELAKAQALASVKVEEAAVTKALSALEQAKRGIEQAQASVDLEKSQRDIAIAEWRSYAEKNGKDPKSVPPMVAREPQRKDVEARFASAVAGEASAKAGVTSAQEMVNRAKKAVDVAQGGIDSAREQVKVAEENIKVAQAQLESARVSLAMAELNIARCTVRAPYKGQLTEVMVNVGQHVAMGQVLTHLVSLDKVQARLPVSKDKIAYLGLMPDAEKGGIQELPLTLTTTIGDFTVEVKATVTRVSPVVNSRTRAYELFAEIDNSQAVNAIRADGVKVQTIPVLPGSFVQVSVAGRRLTDVYEFSRSGLRSSAPADIESKYPEAEWFVAVVRLEKPDGAKETSKAEETTDDPNDEQWSLRYIDFVPVTLVRKEGATALVKDFVMNDAPSLDGVSVITSALDMMTLGMKVRVAKGPAKTEPVKTE